MARARNLKPGFFTDAEVIECDHWVRLLFAGLWTIADREGRLLDKPKQIGVDLFPRESLNIDAGLDELASHGLIVRYEVNGQRLIWIKNFSAHQNPHKEERASTLPPLPSIEEHRASTMQAPEEPGANPADSLVLIADSLNTDSLEGAHDAPAKPKRASQFAEDWQPTEKDCEWARGRGYSDADIAKHTMRCVRHHRSKGNVFKDHALAWRNWLDREVDYGGARASPNGQNSAPKLSAAQRFAAMALEDDAR